MERVIEWLPPIFFAVAGVHLLLLSFIAWREHRQRMRNDDRVARAAQKYLTRERD